MHGRRRRIVVMVWQFATLPMSYYIVRKNTTRSVPQSIAAIYGACGAVTIRFHGDSNLLSSKLRYLRVGTTKNIP